LSSLCTNDNKLAIEFIERNASEVFLTDVCTAASHYAPALLL
jgi:hypothetical protein